MIGPFLATESYISPEWPAPKNIVALTTCRYGGVSIAPYNNFNLAQYVGDQTERVEKNRALLLAHCSGLEHIQWLQQIHGVEVVNAEFGGELAADVCITQQSGLACAVLTADCLPLLLCDKKGRQVAAVHAGWRGLLNGVIENTVRKFDTESQNLLAWLGPAISQQYFEVGAEVRQQFLDVVDTEDTVNREKVDRCFKLNPFRENHFFADLYQLARIRLQHLGIMAISGGKYCSYADKDLFFSYRRTAVTGRMATMIYIKS